MAFQEIILTEKIANLGAESDIVRVRAGYARNFLIPQKKALEKTPQNLARLNSLKTKRAEREAAELNDANDFARRINKIKITIELETGSTGKAFGSVTSADIADRVKAELGGNVEFDRHKIVLDQPIKATGEFEIPVKVHHDVTAKIALTVKAKGAPVGGAAAGDEAAAEGDEKQVRVKARPKK